MVEFFERLASSVLSKLHYHLGGSYTHRVASCTWDLLCQLWYFVVVGIAVAALISLFWRKNRDIFLSSEINSRFNFSNHACEISLINVGCCLVMSLGPARW